MVFRRCRRMGRHRQQLHASIRRSVLLPAMQHRESYAANTRDSSVISIEDAYVATYQHLVSMS